LAVGPTPSRLSRHFAALYSLSPQAYRRQLRLVVATRALARTGSVAATEAGFADTANLGRTFCGQYEIAPSAWARRVAPG
jgi:AraC-like DNA-binding protein